MGFHRLAAVVLLALPSLAFAWGGQGHQVVALIAYPRLTPEAQAATKDLLGAGNNIYDAEVASWADQIKRERRATADWHYVNIPITSDGFDEKRDGHKHENVAQKIDDQLAILADKSQPKEERAEALKWVVHLVGDIVQPLHCADRNHDAGGNAQLCFMPDSKAKKATNLHSVWDTAMLTKLIGKTDVTDYADTLNARVKPADATTWATGSTTDWANESMRVAAKSVYAGIEEGTCPHLTQNYVEKAGPVIEQQFERGGVRLATVLNKALSGTAATRPSR